MGLRVKYFPQSTSSLLKAPAGVKEAVVLDQIIIIFLVPSSRMDLVSRLEKKADVCKLAKQS